MLKKYKISFTIVFLILFLSFNGLIAQEEKLISTKKLTKDLNAFEQIVEAHPDPYAYTSKEIFDAQMEQHKSKLKNPISLLEFYKIIAGQVAQFKDGHSSVQLPNKWLEKNQKKHGAFPIETYLTNDDQLYVYKDFGETGIPIGSKIFRINGIKVDSFLNKIDPYISYELKHFRNTVIDNDLEFYLYLAFNKSKDLEFEYITHDTLKTIIKNIPFKQWKKVKKERRTEKEKKRLKGKPYAFTDLGDGIGHLELYSFSPKSYEAYYRFLNNTFRKIRIEKINTLIIDVRGNFGGWPKIASELFHFVSDKYFKTTAKSTLKVSEAYREYFYARNPRVNRNRMFTSSLHYVDMGSVLQNELNSTVEEAAIYNERPREEHYEFSGDLFLLTNRDSYSMASSFAATFQCYQMGTIIGEETGGTKIFHANAFFTQLKKTGIYVRSASVKNYCSCFDQEMEGVKPNIPFTPSVLEVVNNIDSQLNFTKRVIKKIRSKK